MNDQTSQVVQFKFIYHFFYMIRVKVRTENPCLEAEGREGLKEGVGHNNAVISRVMKGLQGSS